MHIFVPALPVAAADFGVGASAMQMTISVYILGLAGGQLIYGPVSDRFGRRPALMAGLTLYVAASVVAMTAENVTVLIVARLFQALGGCAGLVLGRAIVRDISGETEAARRLALMNLMVTLGPGLAPMLGGLLASTTGWRSIFVVLCALGVVNFILTWRLLPETGAASRQTDAAVVRNYGSSCARRRFSASPSAAAAPPRRCMRSSRHRRSSSCMNCTGPSGRVGPYLAILFLGVWIGSMLASRLLRIVPIKPLLICSNAVSVIAAFVLLAAVLSGHFSVILALGAMFVYTIGVGTASPAALTEAISVNRLVIGSASGLYGFTQMAVGAICTALAGLGESPALAAAVVVAGAGIVAQISFWIAFRGRGTQQQS